MNIPRKRRYPYKPIRPKRLAQGGIVNRDGLYLVGEHPHITINMPDTNPDAVVEAIKRWAERNGPGFR